jgi:hypothetical protein
MKAWYKDGTLRMRIGIITDEYFDNHTKTKYYELQNMESGEYVIRPEKEIEVIPDKIKNN